MRFKTIIRNINLLNIILITSIIIFANYTVLPMFNMNIRYTLPAGKKIVGDGDEKPADSRIPSPADYTVIAEENLFHPERKIPAEKKEEQPLPKSEFVLYGTLITDNLSLAYLEDMKAPYNTPGRGKRQRAMRTGDTISGFTLKEIKTDKVVMVRGEELITVLLNDLSHPKARADVLPTTATETRTKTSSGAKIPERKQAITPPSEKTTEGSKIAPSADKEISPKPKKGFGGLFEKFKKR